MDQWALASRDQRVQNLVLDQRRFQNLRFWLQLTSPPDAQRRVNIAQFACVSRGHGPIYNGLVQRNLVACLLAHLPLVQHDLEIGFQEILAAG